MKLTWGERMAAECEQRGYEKGFAIGLEMAFVEQHRQYVLRMLGKRFGEISPNVRERVQAIDSVEELRCLMEKILDFGPIEELGLGR
ncbi:MAG: DUF4351 domain-containing protein [Acidobacteriota bacterium]